MFLPGFILPGTFCPSWTWLTISFPMWEKLSAISSSDIFLDPFSLSSSGTPVMWMLRCLMLSSDFPGGSDGKASAYNEGDPGSIPGSGRSPGEGNGNPLQYLAWKIPWMEESGGLQSMGSQRVGHDWVTSLRGLLGGLHFFSFYFLYSVLWQWFPPFCPPGHLSILQPQLFCYGFLLCIIHLCLFFL